MEASNITKRLFVGLIFGCLAFETFLCPSDLQAGDVKYYDAHGTEVSASEYRKIIKNRACQMSTSEPGVTKTVKALGKTNKGFQAEPNSLPPKRCEREKQGLEKQFHESNQELTPVGWKDKAVALFEDEKYSEAIEYLNKAIELDPNYAKAYFGRGFLYTRLAQYQRAIEDLDQVISLGPTLSFLPYELRGFAYIQKGDYDRAIADLTKALEIDPHQADTYHLRGAAWHGKGDFDRAIADCTKALEIDPRHADAYHRRALTWALKGNNDRAIADCDKALEIDPRDANAYSLRGAAWQGKGDFDRAIADCDKALEIDPRHADAYNFRGLTWALKGDFDQAIADATKALSLNPDNKNYQEIVAELETMANRQPRLKKGKPDAPGRPMDFGSPAISLEKHILDAIEQVETGLKDHVPMSTYLDLLSHAKVQIKKYGQTENRNECFVENVKNAYDLYSSQGKKCLRMTLELKRLTRTPVDSLTRTEALTLVEDMESGLTALNNEVMKLNAALNAMDKAHECLKTKQPSEAVQSEKAGSNKREHHTSGTKNGVRGQKAKTEEVQHASHDLGQWAIDLERDVCNYILGAFDAYERIRRSFPPGYEREKYVRHLENQVSDRRFQVSHEIGLINEENEEFSSQIHRLFVSFTMYVISSKVAEKANSLKALDEAFAERDKVLNFCLCRPKAPTGVDVKGWANARWGMTEEEIETIFGDRVHRLHVTKRNESLGQYWNLQIRGLRMCDCRFNVSFEMDDRTDRLATIKIVGENDSNQKSFEVFQCLEQNLCEEYGFEPEKDDKHDHLGKIFRRFWRFPSTTVQLFFLEYQNIRTQTTHHNIAITYWKT